ncbi:MAG: transcription-repair coupling factor [Lachnospiraceae bacterium]|nr:transcription-repair coupling factor [Lachnospiraceae bacterium]
MDTFITPLLELAEYSQIREKMKRGKGVISLSGCTEAEKAHMIYGLAYDREQILVAAENDLSARSLYENLLFYFPEACFYPSKDLLFYQADIASNLLDIQRMKVMKQMIEGEQTLVVLPASALMDPVACKEVVSDSCLSIDREDEMDLDYIKERLVDLGYERCAEVNLPGSFAVRGDILDIWSLPEDNPYRIELFGDEIDSLRSFDPESQRSIEELAHVRIYPARDRIGRGAEGTFLNWFPAGGTAIFLDEPGRISEAAGAVEKEYRESIKMRLASGQLKKGDKYPEILGINQLAALLNRRRPLALSALEMRAGIWEVSDSFSQTVQGIASYNGSFEFLAQDLLKYRKRKYSIVVLSASHTRAKRLAEELTERDIPAFYTENKKQILQPGQVAVMYGRANRGFEYPMVRFALISESDIFGEKKKPRKKPKRYTGEKISSFSELKVGDYVVHENHGLAIYRGISKVNVDNVQKDYIKLEYKGGNLYVLATQLDVLQKYAGAKDGGTPRLNRLGGQEWEKTRAKVKASVRDIARELIALYAQRESGKGFIFSPDSEWQREFEEMFPFEETDDQLTAIEDTKKDMEQGKIMDRLICGDVGFGKTEIAIRAAFKAVQDGKQVAYLVPTTILAQQHYNTFLQRMKDYPIRVDLMCRFRTPGQIKNTVADLKKGLVDIVIGTHRLLSKDVNYKDLGLLIIDEEQRFGVAHKEKIKSLRKNVDVLTLTATPIPRTLHMSLVGIRDMSVLTEPPQDRVPIQTFVCEFNLEMVREAICREIARGGQVYFVYNRIADIADMTGRIQKLVPEAVVSFADGKMSKTELERIMVDFINGEIDVLVTTTIIETGLDISNANTMIIHDADKMGLSQLYQLRGRVGRSNRTAYAFLMYRKDKILKEVAEKRLSAIREFTELGSGFKIAMRDLEIRGAGNLLGAEQSGHMDLVGYDLYCKLLGTAVREEKGETVEEGFETVVDLTMDAYIPDSYIPNEFQKMDFYKKIAAIEGEEDYNDVADELMDRCGELPPPVRNLLAIADLKAAAHAAGFTEIKETRKGILNPRIKERGKEKGKESDQAEDREVRITVLPNPPFDAGQLGPILGSLGGMITAHPSPKGAFFLYHGSKNPQEMVNNLKTFALRLAATGKNE